MLQGPCAARGPPKSIRVHPPSYGCLARDTSKGSNQWDLARAADVIPRQVYIRSRAAWVFIYMVLVCRCMILMTCELLKFTGTWQRQKEIEAKAGTNRREWRDCWAHRQLSFPTMPPWPLAPLEMICTQLNCSAESCRDSFKVNKPDLSKLLLWYGCVPRPTRLTD